MRAQFADRVFSEGASRDFLAEINDQVLEN